MQEGAWKVSWRMRYGSRPSRKHVIEHHMAWKLSGVLRNRGERYAETEDDEMDSE